MMSHHRLIDALLSNIDCSYANHGTEFSIVSVMVISYIKLSILYGSDYTAQRFKYSLTMTTCELSKVYVIVLWFILLSRACFSFNRHGFNLLVLLLSLLFFFPVVKNSNVRTKKNILHN